MSSYGITFFLCNLIYIYVNFSNCFIYNFFSFAFMLIFSANVFYLLFLSIILNIVLNHRKSLFDTFLVVFLGLLKCRYNVEIVWQKEFEISKYIGIYEVFIKYLDKGFLCINNIFFGLFRWVFVNNHFDEIKNVETKNFKQLLFFINRLHVYVLMIKKKVQVIINV